jgi:hypothetical protein
MKKTLLLALAFAAGVTPALAAPTICIRHDDIYNWSSLNDKQIVLENTSHQKALLKLIGTCSDFKFTTKLDIRSPGSLRISCVSAGDTIVTDSSGFRGRCSIVSVEPYTGPAKTQGGDHHDTH